METKGLEIWAGPMFAWAGSIGETARRIEDLGFDGMGFADTQIIYYDPYVAMGVAAQATKRLLLRTMVSTPVTRHPSVMAGAIATVQQESAGRAILGLGRGDSAAALIGEREFTSAAFERHIGQLQGYLRGEEVVLDNGFRSRSDWIGRDPKMPKVPIDVAATGPRVIADGRPRRGRRVVFDWRRTGSNGVGGQLRPCGQKAGRAGSGDAADGRVRAGLCASRRGLRAPTHKRIDRADRPVLRDGSQCVARNPFRRGPRNRKRDRARL